ncbi:hypothetical protein CORC01_05892, partial [Colletotrichum orchidophilum]
LVRGTYLEQEASSCQNLTSEQGVGIPGRHFCVNVLPLSGTGLSSFRAILRIRASQS